MDHYARRVVSGEIMAGHLVRLACQRHLEDREHAAERGLEWDKDEADRAIDWFETKLRHSTGAFAGQPFRLEDWQAFAVGSIFGWYRAPHPRWVERIAVALDQPELDIVEDTAGTRRFRTVLLDVGRGNGKTPLCAGIALLMMVGDYEPNAHVYSTATKRDQAKLVWAEAKNMVEQSPTLSRRIIVQTNNMHSLNPVGKFEPLSRDAKAGHGFIPHCAIHDELHLHKSRELWDAITTGMVKRRQPLNIAITSAGDDELGIWGDQRKRAKDILEGQVPDDTYFALVYMIDMDHAGGPGDAWDDPTVWIKANPNLGVSVSMAGLRKEFLDAQASPAAQASFKIYHLGVPVGAMSAFFDVEQWKGCADPTWKPEDLDGWDNWLGGDLALLEDLTALAHLFRRDTGETRTELIEGLDGEQWEEQVPIYEWRLSTRLYAPERALTNPKNQNREAYKRWADEGHLHLTGGAATDFRVLRRTAVELARRFDAYEVALDPWNAGQMAVEVKDAGIEAVLVKMNTQNLSPALKNLQTIINNGELKHDGNPVMTWMMGNVVARLDPNDNVFPRKERGKERSHKIDGPVALTLAMSRALVHQDNTSVYARRGVLSAG